MACRKDGLPNRVDHPLIQFFVTTRVHNLNGAEPSREGDGVVAYGALNVDADWVVLSA